jgi:hypothetical protein
MKRKYKPTKGAPFSKELAQKYGEELGKISSKNNGKLSPEAVVEEAKNPATHCTTILIGTITMLRKNIGFGKQEI